LAEKVSNDDGHLIISKEFSITMKRFSILASFVFLALMASSSFAQTVPANKIGWIVTAAFGDDTGGITKYLNASKALDAEMKPRVAELQGIQARIKTIADDLAKMQSNPAVPIDQKAAAAKQEEGQRLQLELKRKQEDAQVAYDKRRSEVMGPITQNIYLALQDYAKAKGYSVILDVTAMGAENQPSPVLVLDPSADITKDFIAFYNARPATTATTAAPK
jgi:Skp family chaperone for outer membrane proteins